MPGVEILPRLLFTRRVLNEALRLYPPVWLMTRKSLKEDTFAERPVPKGSILFLPVTVLHRTGAFADSPHAFDPDRFLPERFSLAAQKAFIPFSSGPRTCLGAPFALAVATMILARITQRFRYEMATEGEVTPDQGLTLRPKGGIPLRLEARVGPR